MDRVLCAVDAGRSRAAAIREALALAPCATRLGFITITDTAETGSGAVASLAAHRARQTLESALAQASARGRPAETELVSAHNVVNALIARAVPTELLVVGSGSEAPHPGAAAGSVAMALAAHARGPLLVAWAGAGAQGPQPRILVAVDDGATAASLVALAGSLATACDGYVHLVHVQGRSYGAQTRHRLAELSTALIEQTGSEPVVEVARAANVAAHICQLAHDSSSSLLVVGRRGQAGRGLSPVAERILHGSPCSVLVAPPPAA